MRILLEMIRIARRFFAVILNPFSVLGLKETASMADAKKVYKELVMKYHPDINKADEASEKFREITEAFSMVKKRLEARENSAIPKEEGFVSKRPKYDGHISSVLRDDKVREYINFKPLDIEMPQKDRLGIMYRPFFTDSDATHPKTGTIGILLFCMVVTLTYSYVFMNTVQRDELVNQLLYEKLKKKYEDSEWDMQYLHPTLQAVKNNPEYDRFVKRRNEELAEAKFKAFKLAPAVVERFDAQEFERSEKHREFVKIAKV